MLSAKHEIAKAQVRTQTCAPALWHMINLECMQLKYKRYCTILTESVASAAMCTVTALNGFSCLFIFDDTPYRKRRCARYN